MKITLLLTALVIFVSGCDNREEELEKQNMTLQTSNQQLSQDVVSRDEYVDKVVDAINEVYTSVEDVKAKETSLLRETATMESEKKLTRDEMRASVMDRIGLIRETLRENRQRLTNLESKLASSSKQFAGLKKMVASLKTSIEERDKAIADLGEQMKGLETQVTEKTAQIVQKDAVIDDQYKKITTAFYVMGTRDELEQKGIIKDEGGIIGIGSTTILASGFDEKYFKPINKEVFHTIQVDGQIDEIVPPRSPQFYKQAAINRDQSMLTIAEPNHFWKDNYLVIITDRPVSQN